ncbi:OmpA family protein [Sinimarinibacterium sp. NLF-5-8]|uniref:OmpA family protein n=1 Tax=Sinimarinibacterium sp. NLF-5-8 TaxID=2698684 RepID=UPI00137C2F45|nr:OmpA family protein [Sinimarinibacterium sp. NLF-5-8]QHS10137.1 OmpA family protein [Sinimarinibacterium sp. NLF-5-8]
MRHMLASATALALLWSCSAAAVTVDDYDIPYVGAGYNFEISDSARESGNGNGFDLRFGWPLTQWGYSNLAVEGQFHALQRKRDVDGQHDYQRGIMLDLVYDFGSLGWQNGFVFKPFVLGGLGVVQDDVRGDSRNSFGLNFGGGALIPLPWLGLAARLDARIQAQDNKKSVPGEDILIDYRIGAGLQLPLSMFFTPAEHRAPAPAQECELAVVDPITGRSDCGVDSDRDGVIDSLDECPDTPFGAVVDGRGCPMSAVALPMPEESPCFGGFDVQGQACADHGVDSGAGVVLENVTFENSDAILTGEARRALDQMADSLKAQPSVRIEIGGHTDNVGNESFNHILSQERAESVRQYLISRGIDSGRLVAMGYGQFRPIASNRTEAGRAQNRRVEFRIIVD